MRLPTVSSSSFFHTCCCMVWLLMWRSSEMVCVKKKKKKKRSTDLILFWRISVNKKKKRKKPKGSSINHTYPHFLHQHLSFYYSAVASPPSSHLPSAPESNKWINNYRYKHLGAIWRLFFPPFWYSFKHFRLSKKSSEQFLCRCLYRPQLQSRRGDEDALMVICILISLAPPHDPPPSKMPPSSNCLFTVYSSFFIHIYFWSFCSYFLSLFKAVGVSVYLRLTEHVKL